MSRVEIETISAEKAKLDQLVEYHALSSDAFRQALNVAYADAEAVWAPCKRGRDINAEQLVKLLAMSKTKDILGVDSTKEPLPL